MRVVVNSEYMQISEYDNDSIISRLFGVMQKIKIPQIFYITFADSKYREEVNSP